jgi:hypothetical protein
MKSGFFSNSVAGACETISYWHLQLLAEADWIIPCSGYPDD